MIQIREIQTEDNPAIASIIKQVMTEFGADPKTTVLGDSSLDTMFENYTENRGIYFIAMDDNKILGGAGIKKLDGSEDSICELQRMFLLPEARGKNIGRQLLELCITKAKEFGFNQIYLESLKQMKSAKKLYQKFSFKEIPKPMGNTGHCGCDVYMFLDL